MNIRLTTLLLCAVSAMASAQNPNQAPAQVAAVLFTEDGSQPAWIVEASKTAIRYRETEVAVDTQIAKLSDIKHIYIYQPRDLTAAMELYQARKYEEAKAAFIAVKERYQALATLEDSPGIIAAFYEMESLRKLGDLEGLEKALQKFDKRKLTSDHQQRQVDLYVIWRVLQSKNWKSVESLAKERERTRLPGDQRAQVAYCHGLALEALERPAEAVNAFQTALVADAGASEEIAREAALRILTILNEDPDVQRAIRDWGTKDENKNAPGRAKLLEASALALLFEKTLGGGSPLPDKLKDLKKFRPKTEKAEVE
jgi:tetratricopeptide (TPR) repeat protein